MLGIGAILRKWHAASVIRELLDWPLAGLAIAAHHFARYAK
jgi:hypothetical protein